jgi:peptidoglycan/LPS O-acetylase OafA/YrhL
VQVWQSFLDSYRGKSGSDRRVPQVDSLRGLAALLIFFVHYHALMEHWLVPGTGSATLALALEQIAHCGTDLFFTLSGYLIYGSLMARDQPVGRYILRRFGRIYPTFLFVVGGYLLIFAFDPEVSKLPPDSFSAALYVIANLALLPGILEIEPIVAPAWSLSYLGVFYVVAPLMVRFLKLREWQRSQRIALFVAMAAVLLVSGALYHGPVRLAMFLGGMLLYELQPKAAPSHAGKIGAALLIATAMILATLSALGIHPVFRYVTLLVLLPAACGACFAAPTERGPLSWNWLHYLGRITLSYIMVHGLALHLFLYGVEHTVPRAWENATLYWLLVLPAFLVSAASAALVYTLVEDRAGPSVRRATA